jgi:hypothetical protein
LLTGYIDKSQVGKKRAFDRIQDRKKGVATKDMDWGASAAYDRPVIAKETVQKMKSKEKTLAAEAALRAGKYTADRAEESSKKNASDISTNIVTANYQIANNSSVVSNGGGQSSSGPEGNPAWSSIDRDALGGNI